MSLESQIASLTAAANELTAVVQGKVDEIDGVVDAANQTLQEKAADVALLIPTAVADQSYRSIYVDNNGSNTTGDGSQSNPFQTVAHAIDTVGTGQRARIVMTGGQVFDETVACKSRGVAKINFVSSKSSERATLRVNVTNLLLASVTELNFYRVDVELFGYLTGWHHQNNPNSGQHHRLIMSEVSLTQQNMVYPSSPGATAESIEIIWQGVRLQSTDPENVTPALMSGSADGVIVASFQSVTRTFPAGMTWADYFPSAVAGANFIGNVSLSV